MTNFSEKQLKNGTKVIFDISQSKVLNDLDPGHIKICMNMLKKVFTEQMLGCRPCNAE